MRDRLDRGLDAGPLNPSLEALSFADSVTASLEAFRSAAAVAQGPIERHSARVFFIMDPLARQGSVVIDLDVAACAAVLHDNRPQRACSQTSSLSPPRSALG